MAQIAERSCLLGDLDQPVRAAKHPGKAGKTMAALLSNIAQKVAAAD